MLGLFGGKAEVAEDVATGWSEFHFHGALSSFRVSGLAVSNNRLQSSFCQLQVTLASLPCLLFESVKDINAIREFRYVDHTMLSACVDTQFLDSHPNAGERFPIIRLEALLDSPQLEASHPPGANREGLKVRSGRAGPNEPLVHEVGVYKYLDVLSRLNKGRRRITRRCSGHTRVSRPVQEGRTGRATRRAAERGR
jgi:hypothetical protein